MKTSLPLGGLVAPTVGLLWKSGEAAFKLAAMKKRQSGFTLIELLIVVAIAVILLAIAAPNFREMLVKRSVSAAAETLASDMRFARSEALKRSARTLMCRSTNNVSCSTVVGGSWSDGWIIFIDYDDNSDVSTGEVVLRVQQALPNIVSMIPISPANTLLNYRYEPTGLSSAAFSNLVVTPTGSVPAGSTRLLCISRSGRPALRLEGSTAC